MISDINCLLGQNTQNLTIQYKIHLPSMWLHFQLNYLLTIWSTCCLYRVYGHLKIVTHKRLIENHFCNSTFICFLLGTKLSYAVAKNHQALVDIVGFLQSFAFTFGFLCHFTASQIDKVNFSMSCDVDTLKIEKHTWMIYPVGPKFKKFLLHVSSSFIWFQRMKQDIKFLKISQWYISKYT